MRKTISRTLVVLLTLLCGQLSFAQDKPAAKYVPEEAFGPLFYTQNGNEYRSASGAPGPKYWQNRVDYNISASLDEATNRVKATITITYKNNSPEKL
ncbi:M1 family peptidase, partial [Pedobacter chitinilyticus]